MQLLSDFVAMNPIQAWVLGGALLASFIVLFWLYRRNDKFQARAFALVVLVLGGLIFARLVFQKEAAKTSQPQGETSSADPSPHQQKSMVDAAQNLRRLTNETKPDGHFVTEHKPDKGWQPVAKKVSMADALVLISQPLQTRHKEWRANPSALVGNGKGAKVYDYIRSKNPMSWNTGYEPLMTHHFCTMIASGYRAKGNTFQGNLTFYVKEGDPTIKGRVPFWAVVNFDAFAAWLQVHLETPAYPQIARWCSEALKADGITWQVEVPEHPEYMLSEIEKNWAPQSLSSFGQALDNSVHTGAALPREFFVTAAECMSGTISDSPYHGGGLKRRVAGLLWGKMLDNPEVFAGDETLALQCAAFLACNPGFRLRNVISDIEKEAVENRLYVAGVANHAPKLSGFKEIQAGFGSEDPSLQFMQHWLHYAVKALPMNGKYDLRTAAEIAFEERQRNLQNQK